MMRRFLVIALALATLLAMLPGAGSTSVAQTPAPVPEGAGLRPLLDLLPDEALGETGIRYANYELQLAALGIEETGPDLHPDRWLAAIGGSLLVPSTMQDPTATAWREGLGFDLRDVDAMVEAGRSDTNILIMTGSFDPAGLPAVWEASGYAPTETGGVTWYTLGEDNLLDFEHPLHTMHLGSLSHLALLDDGTVVGTAERVDMERVLALHTGEGTSFADSRGAALASAPDDLVSAWIVDGTVLVGTTDPLVMMPNNPNVPADVQERLATQAVQSEEEAPRMPPISLAMVGATAGVLETDGADFPHASRGHAVAVIVPADEGDAAMVAETITRRLTTTSVVGPEDVNGLPYEDIFTDMTIDTAPSGAVIVDLVPAEGIPGTQLLILMQNFTLTLLAWGE